MHILSTWMFAHYMPVWCARRWEEKIHTGITDGVKHVSKNSGTLQDQQVLLIGFQYPQKLHNKKKTIKTQY